MKTQYYTAASLDGFIATEDHSLDWLFPLADVNQSSYPEFIKHIGAIAMGASTYEWIIRNSEAVVAEIGTAWPYTQPVWVFTHRNLPGIAENIHFVQGDVQTVHYAMSDAANGKNIWIAGGGELAAQFYDADLLDEMIIQVGSVTLGKGRPVFPRQLFSPVMRLRSVQQMGEGMVELRYDVMKNT